MRKFLFLISLLCFVFDLSAQMTNTLDKFETVYKDDNITFRKLDENTWVGTGNVMSCESLYLLAGKDKAVLIDAGTTIPGLKEIANKIAGKPVTLVLTHVHPDHAGAVEGFDQVWINPGDTANVPMFMKDYKGEIKFLKNGQKLKLGGRVLEVFFNPGHTPGSVTFLEKGTDRGFCGDAFGTGAGGTKGGILVFTDMETIAKTCRESYKYFAKKGYCRFYCGHFYGDNLMTPERIKHVEYIAGEISEGHIKSTPFDGFFGLNMMAVSDGFTVRFINRSK